MGFTLLCVILASHVSLGSCQNLGPQIDGPAWLGVFFLVLAIVIASVVGIFIIYDIFFAKDSVLKRMIRYCKEGSSKEPGADPDNPDSEDPTKKKEPDTKKNDPENPKSKAGSERAEDGSDEEQAWAEPRSSKKHKKNEAPQKAPG
mmetsp:Transcript_13507/g.31067  ORF Transcript_13507/g.31067 Transcript_13507/m.31067 type:complete len:146 (+) Transcript_13507:82-519(+)